MEKKSQEAKLLSLFEISPFLTVQHIMRHLSVNSPRKMISDLRGRGVPIQDRWVHKEGPHGEHIKYKEYYLPKGWNE